MSSTTIRRKARSLRAIFLVLAFVASAFTATATAVVSTEQPASAALMSNGWYEPVASLPAVSAGFMASGCNGSTAYESGKYHLANDYPKPAGTSVRAIGSGTVVARQENWPGSAVFIRHTATDGTQFLAVYGHLSNAVANGATVSANQQVGTVLSDHVHFGIRVATAPATSNNGAMPCSSWPSTNGYTDPIPYLNAHPATSGGGSTDTDGDGVVDSQDDCPTAPGPVSNVGCPPSGGNGATSKKNDWVDVFGVTSSGAVGQHYWRGSGWNVSGGLGSPSGVTLVGTPAATIHDGDIHVFSRADDGHLYQRVWSGTWGSWIDLGTTSITSGLTAVSPEHGAVDIFGTTASGTIAQHYWRGSGWNVSGGLGSPSGVTLVGAPASTIHSDDYHVFALGNNGHLYQRVWNAAWGSWIDLGTTSITSGLTAVSRQTGWVDVFGVTSSGAVGQHYWRGSGWNVSGGLGSPSSVVLTGTPTATVHEGTINVFTRGNNAHLYQRAWSGSWGGWIDLGVTSIVT